MEIIKKIIYYSFMGTALTFIVLSIYSFIKYM